MNAGLIRQKVLNLRKSASIEDVSRLSAEVTSRFSSISGIEKKNGLQLNVGFYRALPGELDLRNLEILFQRLGSRFFFPRVKDRGLRQLEFVEIEGSEGSWKAGPYGVEEPHPDLNHVVQPNDLDLIFVPGVAFGAQGERVGMGAGYYDRYLAHVSKALRVALAFDFQVFPELEQSATDQPVHWILTEKREVRLATVKEWLQAKGIS